MVKGYKFGILYATKDNQTEDDFYLNVDEGEDLKEFCEWIGQTIELTDWDGYDAGLDVESNFFF
jgi:RAP1 GTPase activating protein 1